MAEAQQTTTGGPSDRVRLAQIAAEITLAVDGVTGLDSGPTGTFATVGGATRVGGVTCASAPGGGFDVSLRLVCALTTLPPIAEAVRAAVLEGARMSGLEVQSVTITIADLDTSDGR